MHILLIHQAFTSLDEAGGTRHFEIASNLAAKGNSISIITSPISYLTGQEKREVSTKNKQITDKIKIYRTYAYPALHKSFILRTLNFISFMLSSFIKGLQLRKVDLVWGTSPPIFQAVSAWLLARLKRVPFLLEVRDLWPSFAIEVGVLKNPILISLSLWLEKFLYRHANLVVVNSPGFIEHVRNKGARKVVMIPNGSDIHLFDTADDGSAFRAKNNLQGKFLVTYAGAHGISNDLGVVLETAKILSNQLSIHFLLIGDGKEKPSLIESAKKLALTNVTFADPVAKNQMAVVLAASDACLAILKPLELYKTTYPNKVFDYMAAGKPVLLAIDGVVRQVIEDAGCGLFIRPGDAQDMSEKVLWLSKHLDVRKKMGIAGKRLILTKFDRARLSEQFIEVLQELMNKP
jgi:glycosyltransferase involved in cell wall biosynthesis